MHSSKQQGKRQQPQKQPMKAITALDMKAMSPGVACVDDAISAWQWGQTMCVERGPSGIIVVMILGPVSEIMEQYSALLHNSSPLNAPWL
jgi:hypothetical protein